MRQYITKPSKHCYYGNITNILNFYSVKVSEAELALLAKILNGKYEAGKKFPFLGFSNECCIVALATLGFEIKNIYDQYELFNTLNNGYPILLRLNSGLIDYSYAFSGTNRNHYIVLITGDSSWMMISDSYVQTIPQSIYHGRIDFKTIYQQFEEGKVSATAITPMMSRTVITEPKNVFNYRQLLDEYISQNISESDISIVCQIKKYSKDALCRANSILDDSHLSDMIYQFKFSGALVRFDYLKELFESNYEINKNLIEHIEYLKSKWNIVTNMMMKCSITKKEDYFKEIFNINISKLISSELSVYQEIAILRGLA